MKNDLLVFKEDAKYAKKSLVLMITAKNIIKLEIIAIILGNIVVLLMISATKDIKYQKKF